MTEPQRQETRVVDPQRQEATVTERRHTVERRRGRGYVLVPALTFLAGLVLGGVLVWVGLPSDGDSTAGGSPEASPSAPATAGPTPPRTVVPDACVRAGRSSGQVLSLVRQAVDALGRFDTQRLQQLLGQAQRLQQRISADVGACQSAARGQ